MNVTKKQFEVLEKIMDIFPNGDNYMSLAPEKRKLINNYVRVLNDLVVKRDKDNKRIADYIAEKRKDNPRYARSKEN